MFYVYILKSTRNEKLYKGFTADLKRRFREHNLGNSTFTRNSGLWRLIYYSAFVSEKDARSEEKFLKTSDGKKDSGRRLKKYKK